MGDITFFILGSHGTYGHLSIGSKVSAIVRSAQLPIEVNLVTDGSFIPDEFSSAFSRVITLAPRPHHCSRGGSLHTRYFGPDIDEAVERFAGSTCVFSTFFDRNLVLSLRSVGSWCVWLSHPLRESSWQLFLLEEVPQLFNQLVFLEDVLPVPNLPASVRPISSVLPPPDYAIPLPPAANDRESTAELGATVIVSCGGGLVNRSADLLRECLLQVARLGERTVPHFEVAPGAVECQEWLHKITVPITVVPQGLRTSLKGDTVLVAQGGYCTVHEAIRAKVPMVVVPAPRMIDDQELRSVLLSRAVGTCTILPSFMDDLAPALRQLLDDRGHREQVSSRMGAMADQRGWSTATTVQRWRSLLDVWAEFPRPALVKSQRNSGGVEPPVQESTDFPPLAQRTLEPYECALLAYIAGEEDAEFTVQYADGESKSVRVSTYVDSSVLTALESSALDLCRGRVLDAGAGTGKHSITLQNRGFDVTAVDTCRTNVGVMKMRGVHSARCEDFLLLNSAGAYDTILLLNRGIGMCGYLARLPGLLDHCARLLRPGGRVITDSTPFSLQDDRSDGRDGLPHTAQDYVGDMRMRLDHAGQRGHQFPWLYVDYPTLSLIAHSCGWQLVVVAHNGIDYLCVLTPPGGVGIVRADMAIEKSQW